jgi:hypothetical protein
MKDVFNWGEIDDNGRPPSLFSQSINGKEKSFITSTPGLSVNNQGDQFGLKFAIWAPFWVKICFVIAILIVQ